MLKLHEKLIKATGRSIEIRYIELLMEKNCILLLKINLQISAIV
jgi:hypothetical protein